MKFWPYATFDDVFMVVIRRLALEGIDVRVGAFPNPWHLIWSKIEDRLEDMDVPRRFLPGRRRHIFGNIHYDGVDRVLAVLWRSGVAIADCDHTDIDPFHPLLLSAERRAGDDRKTPEVIAIARRIALAHMAPGVIAGRAVGIGRV